MDQTTPVPAYLINLDMSTARLRDSTRELERAGIGFTRIAAVDGRGLDLARVPDADPAQAMKTYGRSLKGGEYGCYKSHLLCAQRIIDEGHAMALVFEDDITVDPDLMRHVHRIAAYLNDRRIDWHMVNLGAGQTRIFTPLLDLDGTHRLVAAHYFPETAHALLWSRAGALHFVQHHARVAMTVDNLFRHVMVRAGKGFAVTPPLVQASGCASEIDQGRKAQRYSDRRWSYGLLKQKRFWVNRAIAYYRKKTFRLPAPQE